MSLSKTDSSRKSLERPEWPKGGRLIADGEKEFCQQSIKVRGPVSMKVSGKPKWAASVFACPVAIGWAIGGSCLAAGSAGSTATLKVGPCPADQTKTLASLNATCGTLTV